MEERTGESSSTVLIVEATDVIEGGEEKKRLMDEYLHRGVHLEQKGVLRVSCVVRMNE